MKVLAALSGGGMRGAAQVGMIQEIARRGIVVDAWTGVSTGALQAGYMAQVPPTLAAQTAQAGKLASLWRNLTAAPVSGGKVEAVLRFILGKPSLHRATALKKLLATHLTTAPAAPLEVGAVAFNSGRYIGLRPTTVEDLQASVLASASVPGLFPPVGPDALLDGGTVHVAPLKPAFDLADELWASDEPVVIFLLHCLPLDREMLPIEPGPVEGMLHAALWKLAPRGLDLDGTAKERGDLLGARRTNDVLAMIANQRAAGLMVPTPPSLTGKRWVRLVQIAPAVGPGYDMLEWNGPKLAAYIVAGQVAAMGALSEWPPDVRPAVLFNTLRLPPLEGRKGEIR